MLKKSCLILYIVAVLFSSGCAWENLPQGQQEKKRIIQVTMSVGGNMNPNLFYYIVLNLSGDSNKKPLSVFDGADRGKYWMVYYMYGTPPRRPTGLYRGFGGIGKNGGDLIDIQPRSQEYLLELGPGTVVTGDHMTLSLDLSKLLKPTVTSVNVNLNMIVCNQAIDAQSRLEYEYDPYVYDSFLNGGITLNIPSELRIWNEHSNSMETIPNEHETTARPEADIRDWLVQVISW